MNFSTDHRTESKAGNPTCDGCAEPLYRLDGQLRAIAYGSLVCDAAIAEQVAAAVAARDAELAAERADAARCDTPGDCPHVHDSHGDHVAEPAAAKLAKLDAASERRVLRAQVEAAAHVGACEYCSDPAGHRCAAGAALVCIAENEHGRHGRRMAKRAASAEL